jgi:predicted dehydrogenase
MAARLRVGIAGIHRGWCFAEALKWHPDTEITALCDVDASRLERMRGDFGNPKTFIDYEDMLDSGIDLVIVSSPIQFHVPQAVAALDRGIHVFSEVPTASSLEQCAELVRAVRRSSAKYMMGENCCYMKPHMIVKNMARAGLFGRLYYAEGEYVHEIRTLDPPGGWREQYLFNRRGGTYLTHALGPILDWLDDMVVTVNCRGTGAWVAPGLRGDDSSVLLCTTAKGALISLRNDMISPRPFSGYAALQGTLGAFLPEDMGNGQDSVCLVDPSEPPTIGDHREWRPLFDFEQEYLPDTWRNRPEALQSQVHGGADGLTILDFVEAILNDRPSPIDVYRALDMTVPGLVSEISAHQGGTPVAVPNFRLL